MFVVFVKKDVYKAKKNVNPIKFISKYSLVLCMGVEMGKEKL
jgi:ribosomal protein S25